MARSAGCYHWCVRGGGEGEREREREGERERRVPGGDLAITHTCGGSRWRGGGVGEGQRGVGDGRPGGGVGDAIREATDAPPTVCGRLVR